jgi:hypothetical protein
MGDAFGRNLACALANREYDAGLGNGGRPV